MNYNEIEKLWKKSGFSAPNKLILVSKGNYYAVVDDSTSIITAVSKGRVVYAIARSKIIPSNGDSEIPFPHYKVDYVANMKVISCTENAGIKPVTRFVFENVLPNI